MKLLLVKTCVKFTCINDVFNWKLEKIATSFNDCFKVLSKIQANWDYLRISKGEVNTRFILLHEVRYHNKKYSTDTKSNNTLNTACYPLLLKIIAIVIYFVSVLLVSNNLQL